MRVESDFDLTNYNSFRVKSKCRTCYFPENEGDFLSIYKNGNVDKIIIGGGYNIILSKKYYDKDFVIIGETFANVEMLEPGVVMCEAGASTIEFSKFVLEQNLTGAEVFYDIPSSIGGAVVMNAGASGEEIKDILLKVRYLDLVDMKIKEIIRENIGFEYRNSFFQKNTDKIVLKAWFQLRDGDQVQIHNKMESIKSKRWEKQPKEFPNAGSVFKRPPGYFVGAIIDELQLKGFRIGGAEISTKHGGFIVNVNDATGKDIIDIIEQVQLKVMQKYQINLEVEQRII
jgi:UDP-N-acetylmuramate dehydrogenase